MPVVLFNHDDASTQVFGEVVYRHPVVCQPHGSVVVLQAVHRPLLAVSGVAQQSDVHEKVTTKSFLKIFTP